jgi:uncharacterized damage-inducible protein DinB
VLCDPCGAFEENLVEEDEAMAIIEAFLPEFSQEMASTRTLLERVPASQFNFKPHEKSMTLQALASHVAEIPEWVGTTLEMDVFEMDPSQYVPFAAQSTDELLRAFDEKVAAAKTVMQGRDDAHLLASWKMVVHGKTLFELPRIAVLKAFVLNHLIHHRGQLTVYLRMVDVPLPMLYGPTADEQGGMGG